jgi:hypothetical protein
MGQDYPDRNEHMINEELRCELIAMRAEDIRVRNDADSESVNELRASVGLPEIGPTPKTGPDLPADQQKEIRENFRWWQEWRVNKGWPVDQRG